MIMKDSTLDGYIYAKVCGMLSKSFVGGGFHRLQSVTSLEGLWNLLFSSECPSISPSELAEAIEHKSEGLFLEEFISLLELQSCPPQFLIDLIRLYDYENLKELLFISFKDNDSSAKLPEMNHIDPFSMLHYDKWPNVKSLVAGSPVEWCATTGSEVSQLELESHLDLQYIRTLWNSIDRLPASMGDSIKKMLKDELLLDNLVWSLRLRVYFGMEGKDVLQRLVTLEDVSDINDISRDVLAGPIVKTLDYSINNYEAWNKSGYSPLLNPPQENELWTIDPRWINSVAHRKLFQQWKKRLHQNNELPHVLYCWFKIKKYKLDCIRAVTECLRLGLPIGQVNDVLNISAV